MTLHVLIIDYYMTLCLLIMYLESMSINNMQLNGMLMHNIEKLELNNKFY